MHASASGRSVYPVHATGMEPLMTSSLVHVERGGVHTRGDVVTTGEGATDTIMGCQGCVHGP